MSDVYFYIPQRCVPAALFPERASDYWAWQVDRVRRVLAGEIERAAWPGCFDWTLYTYLQLRDDGFPCSLVHDLPERGIVVAHRDFFADDLTPNRSHLLVCIQADRPPHAYAQLQVVQNPAAAKRAWRPWTRNHFIPFWSQPTLLPRAAERGERFENVAYFGMDYNLAPELSSRAFAKSLEALGLRFERMRRDRWHDFREVDAVIAIRSFGRERFLDKPVNKLVNAWLAGVPAIVGRESAFDLVAHGPADFLRAASPAETLDQLQRLRDDPTLRATIVANGRVRANPFTDTAVRSRWRDFLLGECAAAHAGWMRASRARRVAAKLAGEVRRLARQISRRLRPPQPTPPHRDGALIEADP